MRSVYVLAASLATVLAVCPYMDGQHGASPPPDHPPELHRRDSTPDSSDASEATEEFLSKFYLDNNNTFLTSDVGGPISDQNSLSAGDRGPTLLEDFIFRQKIQHFDHERVPERAVHARGAGSHGVFTSYGDFSNITAASFLSGAGKETPVFVRFSTVAGSRGSADTARDVHGFATRFYTDEGNFDIVGNNIPVFFIQDAILFPDLIHAVKPNPDSEIPQAATAHDTAWDFFSQQPSALHTLFWAMAGNGIVRSYRHMDGFGVHTFRFITDSGSSKLIKWQWRTLQGKASLVWEEAQVTSGKNADFHRQDLFDSIKAGRFPEYELGVQIVDESDQLAFGFDLLDPTKIIPQEIIPVTPLGKMQLNRNPKNFFAETEQIMFQPAHIVRGIDFTDDPLLQGRLFSYLDTQLNRNGGPNFEQLPINQPRVPFHNNNRDGAGQIFIPLSTAAYTPNTIDNGFPAQANQTTGRGFFTSPGRTVAGKLLRAVSPTFHDVWSQPRLFFNSLLPTEQQFLINAIRFETSHLKSAIVKQNVIIQLNRISNDIAKRVAAVIGVPVPAPDPTFYNDNKTAFVSIFSNPLLKLDGLKVGILTCTSCNNSLSQASALKQLLASSNVDGVTVAETLTPGVDQTYSEADATGFDGIIIADGSDEVFGAGLTTSPLYPPGRPLQILTDGFRWGKPIGALGSGVSALTAAGIDTNRTGVFVGSSGADLGSFGSSFEDGLRTFKFLDRFPLDP